MVKNTAPCYFFLDFWHIQMCTHYEQHDSELNMFNRIYIWIEITSGFFVMFVCAQSLLFCFSIYGCVAVVCLFLCFYFLLWGCHFLFDCIFRGGWWVFISLKAFLYTFDIFIVRFLLDVAVFSWLTFIVLSTKGKLSVNLV